MCNRAVSFCSVVAKMMVVGICGSIFTYHLLLSGVFHDFQWADSEIQPQTTGRAEIQTLNRPATSPRHGPPERQSRVLRSALSFSSLILGHGNFGPRSVDCARVTLDRVGTPVG